MGTPARGPRQVKETKVSLESLESASWLPYVIVMAFILVDVVSGVLAAVYEKALSSTVMREGLLRKAALVLILVVATLIDLGQGVLDLGFNVPFVPLASAYIALMEILSIFENACKMNADLADSKLGRLICATLDEKLNGDGDSEGGA